MMNMFSPLGKEGLHFFAQYKALEEELALFSRVSQNPNRVSLKTQKNKNIDDV